MSIEVGQKIPDFELSLMGDNGPESLSTAELFSGKTVVLFALPGAFTPGCSMTHLPGFVVKYDEIIAKGVDTVACLAVNDAFVMDAWGKAQNAENILMLADGDAAFTRALGLELDTGSFGGVRSRRYAMIVEDGVVRSLEIDDKGVEKSSAETTLTLL